MLDVIQLLEEIGQDAEVNCSPELRLDEASRNAEVSEVILEALRSGDHSRIVALLGARTNMVCQVFPAKHDEDEEEKEDDDKEEPDDSSTKGLANFSGHIVLAA